MKINTKELLNALTTVKPGLSNRELIEQANSFAFIDGRVVTYNDEISVSHPIKNLDITGSIKAEELYKFLNKIKAEEIDVSMTETEIIFKSGKSKAAFLLEQEIKLDLEEISAKKKWKKLPKDFMKHVQFVAPSASKDASTAALTCVHVRADGVVEATDRYRVASYKGNEGLDEFLLPSDIVSIVAAMNPSKIFVEKQWVHFKSDTETIMSCRIFSAEFPQVDPILKMPKDSMKIEFPEKVKEVIEKATIFAKRQFSFEEFIYLTLSKNSIKVEALSEAARFEETIKCDYKGAEFAFKTNPNLFLDILKQKVFTASLCSNRIKFQTDDWQYVAVLHATTDEK